METKQVHIESHEDREVRTLVKRIEETQACLEAAREAETKRTLAIDTNCQIAQSKLHETILPECLTTKAHDTRDRR
jgi:hypothetical protein